METSGQELGGAEVTVGDFAVAEEEVRTGGLATGAVGSDIEDFLTDAVPDWLLDFEVCPVVVLSQAWHRSSVSA